MDMDVKRICMSELQMLIEELFDAETIEKANESYEDAVVALESLHNAVIAKFGCEVNKWSSRACEQGTKSCVIEHGY